MVGVEREGGRHKRRSISDDWTREEVPGGIGRCIAQRALEDGWGLLSGVEPVAGHVPVQVEAGEMPAVGLGKLFGQVGQSLEEKLAVPPACSHAVREVSAPMRKLVL